MAIYEEILVWSRRLPAWRNDALRRLCVQGSWNDQDLDEILDLAKQQQGVESSFMPALLPVLFAPDHLPAEANQDRTVVLRSLNTLTNVGKIPNNQALDFHPSGLTIVYGGNGAGKSGYARVLKQACRARSPGAVHPDAYAANYQQLVPSAVIDFVLDGTAEQTIWSTRRDNAVRTELRGISVFDGDCAQHYLQSREAANFQPSALTYLQQLANNLNQALRPRLQAEIAALVTDTTPFSIIPADTDAGRSVHPIGPTTDLTRARQLALLDENEQAERARLPREISEADPTAKAALLDHAATRVLELANRITTVSSIVSDEAIDAKLQAHRALVEAETAERAASALLQTGDSTQLLPGTGQGPWTVLFNAAREYSSRAAYPAQPFPVTDDAVCVLCQQELSSEAKDRLQRFDNYIRDRAAETAHAARKAWHQIAVEVGQACVDFTVTPNMLDSLRARNLSLPENITTYQGDLAARLQWLKKGVTTAVWENRPTYQVEPPIIPLIEVAETLRVEAGRLRANMNPGALAAKTLRLKELEARQLLSENIESIARAVNNLAHRDRLQRCLNDIAATRPISTLAGQLARTYISEALAGRMNEELIRLELRHIAAKISSSGEAGAARLGIQLSDCQLAPHQVLSEAEQRMCALAYFFAELHQSGSTSGIVFDDPVSSLDHSHRTAVARRIVEESTDRQVIVFTHDAVFFGELNTLCHDAGLTPAVRSITYRAEGPGYVDVGLPYDMRRHRERIAQHRRDHQQIASSFSSPPGDVERYAIRNAYSDLRVTIEIGIEDTILNETVVRFRDGISVGRLNGVMAVEEQDFREVQRLHDKCCRNVSAHSHAAGQQRPVTHPDELLRDIDAVNTLFSDIRRRRG
ncbi:AAA family ATPase [Pseudomonas oryzihabitans]|uniref:AAA family ATPase n=1 Tax=Pseudomonas oryzihabitans TaxID=47885 RepID=UPI00255400C6|nr:AAA family ATPase [Pseudomonas oryzihabitans]MDK8264888.1 AAA family ATPase [Pseudomonas oryzihabitans]